MNRVLSGDLIDIIGVSTSADDNVLPGAGDPSKLVYYLLSKSTLYQLDLEEM